MTKTKIGSAIGFDGGGYEDASGRIYCSPSTSIHFSYEAGTRLAVLPTRTQSGKKERRRRRRSQEKGMEMRPANTAEEQYSTRACGLAQLAEGRQRKISGHERRARLGSA